MNLTGVTQVRLTVTPYNTRAGAAASVTQDVPDLNAPNGAFTVSWVDRTGTITQTSLTDDGPVNKITRTVSWGDGTAAQAWGSGTSDQPPLRRGRPVPPDRHPQGRRREHPRGEPGGDRPR